MSAKAAGEEPPLPMPRPPSISIRPRPKSIPVGAFAEDGKGLHLSHVRIDNDEGRLGGEASAVWRRELHPGLGAKPLLGHEVVRDLALDLRVADDDDLRRLRVGAGRRVARRLEGWGCGGSASARHAARELRLARGIGFIPTTPRAPASVRRGGHWRISPPRRGATASSGRTRHTAMSFASSRSPVAAAIAAKALAPAAQPTPHGGT